MVPSFLISWWALQWQRVEASCVGAVDPQAACLLLSVVAAADLGRSRLLDSIPRILFGVRDRRVLQLYPTDAWLLFFMGPTLSDLVVAQPLLAGLRFYLLLPQLLRSVTAGPLLHLLSLMLRMLAAWTSAARMNPSVLCCLRDIIIMFIQFAGNMTRERLSVMVLWDL